MTSLLIILIAITVISCLYAIIVSTRTPILSLILVPLLVGTCFYTWHVVNYYKGYPLTAPPMDREVQVVSATMAKPWVLLLIKEDEHPIPRYYVLPHSKSNEEQFKGIENMTKRGVAFKGKLTFNDHNEKYEFQRQTPNLPPKKQSIDIP